MHEEISISTYIRKNFPGKCGKANELLGEPYAIHGIVVTIIISEDRDWDFLQQILFHRKISVCPNSGSTYPGVLAEGKLLQGVTNIGRKPTITWR